MDHEKQHYRRDERGVVRYDANGKGAVATLQQRTAVGKHKDGSVYLRATDSEDLTKIKDAADALGLAYRQRRGGAYHFGRAGSYEHLHFEHPADVANVHAAIGYHLEDNGKTDDMEAHLQKLGGGLKTHVRGKDARVDACMVNTEHARQMSLDANKADMPETHRSAGQFHRLSAQAHRAQAARPWTKGEGAHHVGLAILHNEIASQHDKLALAAHKRIQAEMKRKAEMKARMEAMEEGRETKKAHAEGDKWVMPLDEAIVEHKELVNTLETTDRFDDDEEVQEQSAELEEMKRAKREAQKALVHAHYRIVDGKLVQVQEHHDSRPDAHAEAHDATDGKIDGEKAPTYKKAVELNLKHMGTHASEWEACPVSGMSNNGDGKMAPVIDWPKDYSAAPTMYPGEVAPCCELCGTPIKNVYGLQNHNHKWFLRVGSECVTHFAEGKSGHKLGKEAIHAANVALYQEALDIRKQIEDEYTSEWSKARRASGIGGPHPHYQEWVHAKAWRAWDALMRVTTTGKKDYQMGSPASMAAWVKANKDKAAEAIAKAEELLGRSFKKADGLSTVGAGTDLSTLEGGGALRAENKDDELSDATMGREVQKAAKVKLHTVARVQAQMLRAHPGMRMSASFEDAVKAARKSGITDAEILRTVKNATGAFAPLVKHLEENQ